MFFWENYKATNKQNYINEKESDSFLVRTIQTKNLCQNVVDFPKSIFKRILLCTSNRKYKSSITVEISMILPIFLYGIISLIYLLEIMAIQMSIRSAMEEVAYQISTENLGTSGVNVGSMKNTLVEIVGVERLEQSIIRDGENGLDLGETQINYSNGVIELKVKYCIKLPLPYFVDYGIYYEESLKFKRWTGYNAGMYLSDTQVVYVTESQSVYHTRYSCSHLQLQIECVAYDDLVSQRNENGGIYGACRICNVQGSNANTQVYITVTGGSYHTSLTCSGLKRTITTVSLDEIIGLGVCQRCGG